MCCDACSKLGADDSTNSDSQCGSNQNMTESEVADDTDEGGDRQYEGAGSGGDMGGEAECINHSRYMDDTTADAEYAREKACSDRRTHAERAIVREGGRVECAGWDDFLATIEEKQSCRNHEATEHHAKCTAGEEVSDIAAE